MSNQELEAKIDANLRRGTPRPQPNARDRLQQLRREYALQWREQPINFGCLHFAAMVLGGAVYFVVFVLPSPF